MTESGRARVAVAVIADDLSGATEVAGVGWRRGLSAEVHCELGLDPDPSAQLVVVDTDSRCRGPEEMRSRLGGATAWLAAQRPRFVYKKTDSVLRGWVRAELELLLAGLGRPRAVLVPANPTRGRQVRGGRYFVDGRPINETEFARDPVHPIASSQVLDMLGPEGAAPVCFAPCGTDLPARGVAIGEAAAREDLLGWARRLDARTLAAGAAEFFDALLERAAHPQRPAAGPEPRAGEATLLVSGSTSDASRGALATARERGLAVLPMPDELFHNDERDGLRLWTDATAAALDRSAFALVAIDRPTAPGREVAARLSTLLAELVAGLLERRPVSDLWVEGGATAAAVIRRLEWQRLTVRRELSPGIVELGVSGPRERRVTIKPGSYAWPEEIWNR